MTALAAPFAVNRSPEPDYPAGGRVAPRGTSALGTLLGAFFSLGLYPVLAWPGRWAATAEAERPFLIDTARWWQGLAKPTDAAKLDAIAARLRPRPILAVLPWLVAGYVALAAVLYVMQYDLAWSQADAVTFGFYRHGYDRLADDASRHLHGVWTWGLFAAYVLHWYAVRSHVSAVSDLIRQTNKMSGPRNGPGRIRNDVGQLGLRPLWVIGCVGLCLWHVWWAIPMVLVGAMQNRYACKASSGLQAALAGQARRHAGTAAFAGGPTPPSASSAAQPRPPLPPLSSSVIFCPAPACGCRLPAAAHFCSRCGTPVAHGAGMVVA